MNPFLERYKNHSNAALLKILAAPGNYQPLALEAAKQVLESRNLSEADIAAAQADLENEQAETAAQKAKEDELKNKVQAIKEKVLDEVNPFQVKSPTIKRIIIITTLVFSWFTLQSIYVGYTNWPIFMEELDASYVFMLIALYLVLLLQVTGTVLFAIRKKAGWIIMASYAALTAVSVLPAIYRNIMDMVSNPEPSLFDYAFEQPASLSENIVSLFVFPGLLVVMNRADVREVYRVTRRTFFIILIIVAAFVLGFSGVAVSFLG
jgi:hypothetical protein